jgi:hypothetical protein
MRIAVTGAEVSSAAPLSADSWTRGINSVAGIARGATVPGSSVERIRRQVPWATGSSGPTWAGADSLASANDASAAIRSLISEIWNADFAN